MYLNKVFIIGNLTRDPELKSLPSGIQVASFGLATNRVWKDKEGSRKETPEFHNVVVFGRQAEVVSQYLKRGRMALVEGRIQTRSWEGQDGVKKYRTEIIADRVQFGPGGAGGAAAGQAGAAAKVSSEEETIQYPEEDIKAEDIPF